MSDQSGQKELQADDMRKVSPVSLTKTWCVCVCDAFTTGRGCDCAGSNAYEARMVQQQKTQRRGGYQLRRRDAQQQWARQGQS